MHDEDPAHVYAEAAAAHAEARLRETRWSRLVSYGRLASFLTGAACLLAAFPGEGTIRWLLAVGLVFLAGFFVLVWWHGRIEARERWHDVLAHVNAEAAARVRRTWGELPAPSVPGPGPGHDYAEDLDVFGHASLFALLGSVGTETGRQTLAGWLLQPALPPTVRERQAAVKELSAMPAFRERLAALGRLVEPKPHELEGFLEWAESPRWLTRRAWFPWLVRLIAVSTVALASAHALGLTSHPFWLYPLVIAVGLVARYEARIHHTFNRAFARERIFQEHAALFATIASARFESVRLRTLQASLAHGPLSAPKEMARLGQLMRMADLRFQAFFHLPVNLLTLWDFHVLASLEAWQKRTGCHLREWFAVLGEVESLCALAWLAHDNPSWAFPEIADDAGRVDATALGHPLLPARQRVDNDVTVGPPGSFLMVTGSNMSGKSTLLRAIGTNVVLAQAGGPVCARRLVLPPVALFTSMRVQDSLEEGVSYFMAALRRLKLIVSAAEQSARGERTMLLYLLDEILQGTNTAERQVAVRRILGHLLGLPVIGAVTTHDLELAASPGLAGACHAVHFSEGVETGGAEVKLSFDYRLRPGVATSRNALKLLELVGLSGPVPRETP